MLTAYALDMLEITSFFNFYFNRITVTLRPAVTLLTTPLQSTWMSHLVALLTCHLLTLMKQLWKCRRKVIYVPYNQCCTGMSWCILMFMLEFFSCCFGSMNMRNMGCLSYVIVYLCIVPYSTICYIYACMHACTLHIMLIA